LHFAPKAREIIRRMTLEKKGWFFSSIDIGLVHLACSQIRRMLHRGNEEKTCVALLVAVGNGVGGSSEYAVLNITRTCKFVKWFIHMGVR